MNDILREFSNEYIYDTRQIDNTKPRICPVTFLDKSIKINPVTFG